MAGKGGGQCVPLWEAWISVYEFISANIISGLRFAREKAPGGWAMSISSYSDTTVISKKSGESAEIYEIPVENRSSSILKG